VHTVTATRPFSTPLEEMVARCRKLDSRSCWPGTTGQWETGPTLYYDVAMRLSPATLTDITVTEQLGPVQDLPDGAVFRTVQRVTWPDGSADAEAEYRFTAGTPNTLTVTYGYEAPSTRLVKAKALPAFQSSMEKVVVRYLDELTGAVVTA
jgi:hypothetical protein